MVDFDPIRKIADSCPTRIRRRAVSMRDDYYTMASIDQFLHVAHRQCMCRLIGISILIGSKVPNMGICTYSRKLIYMTFDPTGLRVEKIRDHSKINISMRSSRPTLQGCFAPKRTQCCTALCKISMRLEGAHPGLRITSNPFFCDGIF